MIIAKALLLHSAQTVQPFCEKAPCWGQAPETGAWGQGALKRAGPGQKLLRIEKGERKEKTQREGKRKGEEGADRERGETEGGEGERRTIERERERPTAG